MGAGLVSREILKRLLLVLALAWAGDLRAQRIPQTAVRVTVRDTTRGALAGVDVAVVRGLKEVLATGFTDDAGRRWLTVPQDIGDYQLVVRKVGYQRVDRFFRTGTADTLSFDIVLAPVVQQLAAVTVTAEQDLKRKSYHIDADEIANSDRLLIDATDILAKLKPDMICGRMCRPMASITARTQNPARRCPGLALQQQRACPVDTTPTPIGTNVWVNGRRISSVIPDELALARRTGVLAGLSPGTMTVLSEIKPEHIAEITYADSFDTTVNKVGAQDAIFIVLKPDVGYVPGRPSYVIASKAADSAAAPIPGYRRRLLGVFNESTGDPIEGAVVLDVLSGTSARTTITGTVSLVYLPEGARPVRVTRPGFDDIEITVDIAPANVNPITLVMQPRPPG